MTADTIAVDAPPRKLKVVAIQPHVQIGAVEANTAHLADLIAGAAKEHEPEAIFLPEAMTSPNAYDRRMRGVARPLVSEPLQMMRRAAREYGCVVGGGFIAVRGQDTRGTYAVCDPDGTLNFHDKDQPSFWENNYYGPGTDDGVVYSSSLGPIGCANGFEWGRTRTTNRMLGRIRMLAGGMHFPSFPTWKVTKPWFIDRDHESLLQYARETPARQARMLGVPAIHPSHVGPFTMETLLMPGVKWPSMCVGETQIVDADGVHLGRMAYEDGEGWICAEVTMAEPEPRDPVPPMFWNSLLPISVHAVWHLGNVHGRAKYLAMKALRKHSWQHEFPAENLPDHVPAEVAPPIE